MDRPSKMNGRLKDTALAEVFSNVIKSDIRECGLTLISSGWTKQIYIQGNVIRFIYSENSEITLCEHLKTHSDIPEKDLLKARSRSEENGSRLGKVLVKMNLINYQELWEHVISHQLKLLNSILSLESGEFSISEFDGDPNENITLDLPLSEIILEQIRTRDFSELVEKKFEMVEKIYVKDREPLLPVNILPFESHVLHLCLKYRDIDRIIAESELIEADTLKYIYYYFLINVLSTVQTATGDSVSEKDHKIVNISFSSYEEALKHYNIKFEMIFKILSKEIGPVALSILAKSIDDIRENLPVFLKSAGLDRNGKLVEKKLLKKVWYHDFETHSAEFVRGLEELLYAQIYAVKKNLGMEYENQILKWLKGTGN